MAFQKIKKKSFEKGNSDNLKAYNFHFVSTKKDFFCWRWNTLFGRKKCSAEKYLCGSKNDVYFQVFLRVVKVMQFFSAINNCTNNCPCHGVFADGNTKSLESECL